MSKPSSIADIQKRLHAITEEMIALIQTYKLEAQDPLEIIPTAKRQITDKRDYVRFLELSLEGRLLGEAAEHMERAEQNATKQ